MYKYAALIICFFCFFCNGCEEKAAPPPPKPKIVHKKIDHKPVDRTEPADATSPEAKPNEKDPPVEKADGSKASAATASQKPASPVVSDAIGAGSQGSDGEGPSADQLAAEDSSLSEQELQDILNMEDGPAKDAPKKPSGYSAKNKIDPFEPLFKPKKAQKPKPAEVKERPSVPKRRLTPLEKVDLDQLKLVGIVRADSGNKALVEDASGKGYIVIHGTYMGIHSGKVVGILKDRIVVEEEDKDMLGNVRVHKREMKFQRPSGDEYYEM